MGYKHTLLEDDSGVSPAIAVLLTVAIVLVLSVTIGALVLDLGEGTSETGPSSALEGEQNGNNLVLEHDGGDTISPGDTRYVEIAGNESININWNTNVLDPTARASDTEAVVTDPIRAGDELATVTEASPDDSLSLVWFGSEGEGITLLSDITPPDGIGGGGGGGGGGGNPFVTGTVSTNPDISGATVEAIDSDGSVVASDTTDSNGEYSLGIDASKVSRVTVSVEGASLAPFSNPLYASSTQDVTGSGSVSGLDFTFSTTADATPTVNGNTISVVYGAQEGNAGATPIGNVQMLQAMNDSLSDDYVLVRDIDASATNNWNNGFKPIGSAGTGFSGTFDGQGHEISNLFIDRGNNNVGLFGKAVKNSGFEIKNVGVVNADVTGNIRVGVLAGNTDIQSSGAIENVYATGSVEGTNRVGGLIGNNGQDVKESYASVTVTGTGSGITNTGGLVGNHFGSEISNSYATGDVTGGKSVGGLVGGNEAAFLADAIITQSYATGDVSGSSNVGGLVGSNGPSVFPSFSSKTENSYWDTSATNQGSAVGVNKDTTSNLNGLSTSKMQGGSANTEMSALDFTSIWEIVSGDYPELQAID